MKNFKSLLLLSILIFFCFSNLKAQINQPGQIDVLIYPGSQINEEYLIDDGSLEPKIDALLFDNKTVGTLCINSNTCYENIVYNVDLQSEVLIMDVDGAEKFLSWNYVHSLTNISNSGVYKVFTNPVDKQNVFALLLFSNKTTSFYKKYFLLIIKPNYRPEFDTGTKVLTVEVRDEYVFIDENGNYSEFNKLSRGQLKRNLPEGSKALQHIENEKPSIKSENDFIALLKNIY